MKNKTLTYLLAAAAITLFVFLTYDALYGRRREFFYVAPGVFDQLASTEAFGMSPGTLTQLASTHVPTDRDVNAFALNRERVRKDLIDMTGSA